RELSWRKWLGAYGAAKDDFVRLDPALRTTQDCPGGWAGGGGPGRIVGVARRAGFLPRGGFFFVALFCGASFFFRIIFFLGRTGFFADFFLRVGFFLAMR